jgi:single-stranded-DNA-specific exonuclease
VDHHQIDPSKGLPHAFAIVDPQRADDESGLRQLCGCALAFYLCMGIRMLGREQGFFSSKGIPEPNLKSLLDLVVIATAADMVPLTGDNRTLVKHGLDVLRSTDKPGLRELMKVAGIEVKNVGPSNLGFALGPRINASGRMGSAETAYRVLTTKDPEEGRRLALELESVNTERAELQNRIWDEVRAKVEAGLEKGRFSHSVVVGDPSWHEGVVGIVASKVTEHFHRPAVILAIREDGIAKGSVRSYGGCNILEVLHLSKGHLLGYGGHKYAAGLSLRPEQIDSFSADFNNVVSAQVPEKRKHPIRIESYCELEELDLRALEEIERLAPFGPGHPEPVFAVRAKVEQQSILKGRHVKLRLGSSKTRGFEGIWFNAAERLDDTLLMEKSAQSGKPCEFAGIPEINRFLGKTNPTLRIKSARAVE